MHGLNTVLAPFLSCLLLIGPVCAQTSDTISREQERGLGRVTSPYRMHELPPVKLANSNRIEALLRAGKLYLSLQDVIALALENNLDIELERYGVQIADANLLRAQAGGLLRGVTTAVQQGPASAPLQTGQATGITTSAAQQASAASSANTTGTVISQTGTTIPNLDPAITGFFRFGHTTNPQTSAFVSGTNTLITRNDLANFSYQQGFLSGTSVSLGLSNSRLTSTSLRSDLNPSTTSSLSLGITQRLLQGFGLATNSRNIRIAKNNRELNDLVFKAQVITTVAAVINLYWDLVSFNEDVKVKQQAVELNQKLLSDNKKQVEIGTLAPIEIVRAEAELASAQQDLTVSDTRVLQQETILKNALSRTGVASPSISDARIVATDQIKVPEKEAIEPIQDMIAEALRARPELAQRRIQVANNKINLDGSRSQLKPSLDATFNLSNNGLAGDPNGLPLPPGSLPRSVPAYFLGGYSNVLSQLFRRNFPDYNAGFQLNIPLRNRSARADMVLDQITVRQSEIAAQQLENQIRLDVVNALIAVQQSRAAYDAAAKTRVYREQTLDAEQKKLALGASTIYNVILVQRDLVTAQSAEVAALTTYGKAKVQLNFATGRLLEQHNISIDEAFRGSVSRPPSPLPAVH